MSHSLRWVISFAFGNSGGRGAASPGDRLGRPEHEAQVLDVEVVEADVVDVLGAQPDLGQRLVGVVPDRRQHLVGEELAELLDQLRVVRRLGRALGDGRLVGERLQLAVEVLELDDLEAVDDVDVGVGALRGAAEGELERVAAPRRCRPCGRRGRGSRGSRSGPGTRPRPRGSPPGRSPRGQVALASSNSWNGLSPIFSILTLEPRRRPSRASSVLRPILEIAGDRLVAEAVARLGQPVERWPGCERRGSLGVATPWRRAAYSGASTPGDCAASGSRPRLRLDLAGHARPVGLGRGRDVAQVPLGVEGAHGAGAGGGDGLAVGVVDEVADREDAGEVGPGGLPSVTT